MRRLSAGLAIAGGGAVGGGALLSRLDAVAVGLLVLVVGALAVAVLTLADAHRRGD